VRVSERACAHAYYYLVLLLLLLHRHGGFNNEQGARSPTGERVNVIIGNNYDEGTFFMDLLWLVVRGLSPGARKSVLTDDDVRKVLDTLSTFRPQWCVVFALRSFVGLGGPRRNDILGMLAR
jgi:hypothetical protein